LSHLINKIKKLLIIHFLLNIDLLIQEKSKLKRGEIALKLWLKNLLIFMLYYLEY